MNGGVYIGKLVKKDNQQILKDAYYVPNSIVDERSIADYLEAKNMNQLIMEDFSGLGTIASESIFTDDQKLSLAVCKLKMKQAKNNAVRKAENAEFRSLMGK